MRLRVYKSRRIAFVFFFSFTFSYVAIASRPPVFSGEQMKKPAVSGRPAKKIVAVKAVDAFGEP